MKSESELLAEVRKVLRDEVEPGCALVTRKAVLAVFGAGGRFELPQRHEASLESVARQLEAHALTEPQEAWLKRLRKDAELLLETAKAHSA
jgi:hypothetical protein